MYSQIKSITARIETDGLTPLKKILKKLGGWPVLEGDTWIDENFDWINTSSQFHNAGYSSNYVISFNINMDMKNTSRRIIYVRIYFRIYFYLTPYYPDNTKVAISKQLSL